MELSSQAHSEKSAQGMTPPMALIPEGDQGSGNAAPVPAAPSDPAVSVQSEFTLAGQSPPPTKQPAPTVKKAVQDVLVAEGLLAVKLAVDCQNLDQLQEALVNNLGQNSMETRRRYAQSIMRWFFPDGVDGLLRRVWVAYQDGAILTDLLRWSFLEQEKIMGACVTESLFPLQNGITIPATYLDKFLTDLFGEAPPEKTRQKMKINLKK